MTIKKGLRVGKQNALSGARAPAYDGEYYTPTLRLAMWHAWRTQGGPSQSPSRSLETSLSPARPRGTCLRPGAKVSGSQTDLLPPWYDGRAEITGRYRKGTSHVGWGTGDLPSQEENYGYRTISRRLHPVWNVEARRHSRMSG